MGYGVENNFRRKENSIYKHFVHLKSLRHYKILFVNKMHKNDL